MNDSLMSSYAIDFGTSNTVITRWNRITQQPEIIKLNNISQTIANNPALIPSLIYLQNAQKKEFILGQEVRDLGLDISKNSRFFRDFKRGIGATIQGFLPELDEINITFEQVGEWFLTGIIQELENNIQEKPQSLVLTVPVDSFEDYRHWLTQVCQNWSIDQVRILDEPTAAALGYGADQDDIILVIDFGGGTLDFSLVKLNISNQSQAKPQGFILKWGQKVLGENSAQLVKTARVLGKVGRNLGGADLDNWLTDYFAKTQGIPQNSLTTRLAEKIKIQLSSNLEASEIYFNEETLESYELELDQKGFENILKEHQFFEQLDDLMTQVLQQGRRNGIEVSDINMVLLVGGTVKIPSLQTWVKQYFDESKIRCDKPFEAIAWGALQLTQGFELKDFLYHSYGVRYWNRKLNRHSWHPIIKTGQAYPMDQPIELVLGASLENQPSIELIIGELGTETGGTEVYFDGDRLVTRTLNSEETNVKPLNDQQGAKTIAKLDPPGYPGSDRIKLQFWVDKQRFLRVTVEDLLINETLINRQMVAKLT
jgi:molecular chaperone DnaK (HSP70)